MLKFEWNVELNGDNIIRYLEFKVKIKLFSIKIQKFKKF